jgi:inosine-uridine nucleoside N-ribohydrolase
VEVHERSDGHVSTTNPQPAHRTWRLGETPWAGGPRGTGPHARVVIDNDFSGDPDDLYQLVHHLLSPAVDIRAVIASHRAAGDPFDPSTTQAANAEAIVHDLFDLMGLLSHEVVHRGAETALVDATTPHDTPAARAIIAEARRADAQGPLYVVAGGGLTDLASAYLLDPGIADLLTVVWIGGREHEGLAVPPPGADAIEYNLNIDLVAGQVVFASGMPIWQVPRDVYRRCLVSEVEIRARVAPRGPVGARLAEALRTVTALVGRHQGGAAETYALGDSPLVLLTALQSLFQADPSSSDHVEIPTPHLDDDGGYVAVPGARPMRVYTRVDTRLMFEDLFGKLDELARWQAGA